MKDVCSPISRKGSLAGSNPPLSPGARSHPSAGRGDAEAPVQVKPETHVHMHEPQKSSAGTAPGCSAR
jgi:hypothetical protein